jgi:uncharacterized repeat protein (TIGR01451 family)
MYARAALVIIAALLVMVAPAAADEEGDAFVTKSGPASVASGDTITYTITVGSNGPGPAVDVELIDPVPEGTSAVSVSPENQCDEVEPDMTVLECDFGTVTEANPETITFVVQTSASTPETVTNVVTITSGDGASEPSNTATATTQVESEPTPPPPPPPEPPPSPPPPPPSPPEPPPSPPEPPPTASEADLFLTKADAPDPVGAGGELTYVLTATNAGADGASGIQLVDDLPNSTSLVSATPSQGSCSDADPVFCFLGNLASSASASVTIVVKVSGSASLFNVATVFAAFPDDPAPGNNSAGATTAVASTSPPAPPPPPSPSPPPAPPPPVTPPPTPPPSPPPTTTLAAAPDVIPPRNVTGVRATVGNRSVLVSWRAPSDPDFERVELTRATGGQAERVIYAGTAEVFRDRSLRNGVRYVYRIRTFDRSGNASSGVQFAATPKILALFSPQPNARVSSPPLLRWVRVRGARFYNVQLYRGSTKVHTAWPRTNRFQLRARWSFRDRRERLSPGTYHWFVWSGRGSRSRPRYGPLLGQSSFVVTQRGA